MIGTIRDIWRKRAVVGYFAGAQLSSSYRTKSFGFLWALLDPLMFMLVYFIVFGTIMAERPPSFMLHLFIGVIAFRFLNAASTQGAGILRSQGGLIREIRFPKAALPVSVVVARLFDFGAGWLVAFGLAFAFHLPPNVCWLLLPVVILAQVLFVMGFTLLTSYVGLFFSDIHNFLAVALRLWFYLSPVLYPLEQIQMKAAERPDLLKLYMMNPMVGVLECYYAPVLRGELPPLGSILYATVFSLGMIALGLWVFSRAEGQIAKYV